MPNVPQKTLEEMINSIENPKRKEVLSAVVSGKYQTEIHCLSKTCKGRVVGYITPRGQLVSNTNPKQTSGARRIRKRFDGKIGVLCLCGARSSLAEAEKGIIGGGLPSKSDLQKVSDNMESKPTKIKQEGNAEEVDGFRFVELKV